MIGFFRAIEISNNARSVIRLSRGVRNGMLNGPVSDALVVPADVGRRVVRPGVVVAKGIPKGKDVDVGLAHDKLAQRVDAVVHVAGQVVVLGGHVAALGRVVLLVVGLPHQVQAVQLVEDLDSDAVAVLARPRVRDLERSLRVESDLDHLLPADHGVGNCGHCQSQIHVGPLRK